MKKTLAIAGILALSGCSMLSPYAMTFTTPDGSVVDPSEDTLDFVLNAPAYAYVGAVSCDDGTNRALAPSFNSGSEPTKVYNLELSALDGVSSGSLCNLTVNVFDKTTSSESRDFISLYVLEKPELTEETEGEATDTPEEAPTESLDETDVTTETSEAMPAEETPSEETSVESTTEAGTNTENVDTEPTPAS